jgi:hypothetical protein
MGAVYETFCEAVIGLAEAVFCITREAARQQPMWAAKCADLGMQVGKNPQVAGERSVGLALQWRLCVKV